MSVSRCPADPPVVDPAAEVALAVTVTSTVTSLWRSPEHRLRPYGLGAGGRRREGGKAESRQIVAFLGSWRQARRLRVRRCGVRIRAVAMAGSTPWPSPIGQVR